MTAEMRSQIEALIKYATESQNCPEISEAERVALRTDVLELVCKLPENEQYLKLKQ